MPSIFNRKKYDSPLSKLRRQMSDRIGVFMQAATPVPQLDFCPQKPTERQRIFLELNCREAFYGGSAGGGKSSSLLMAAAQYVHIPGYSALLLRKSYADLNLPGALMDRARTWWYGRDGIHWNEKDKVFTFPSGAKITFGYLQSAGDEMRYKSAEFQFIGFDELTQFREKPYTFLFSRLRRLKGVQIPIRMRSGSNPGDIGHAWVKDRFLTNNNSADRQFVPAFISDNPYLDREEYEKSLQELDVHQRKQMLEGNWEDASGGTFARNWFSIVDRAPKLVDMVRSWDLAATVPNATNNDPDYTAGVLMGKCEKGDIYILDVRRVRLTPGGVEDLIIRTALEDGVDVQIAVEEEGGSGGKFSTNTLRRKLMGYRFNAMRSTGSKEVRAKPLASYAEHGGVYLLRAPWNRAFLDEYEQFPIVEHDDQVDAGSCGFRVLSKPAFTAHAL